MSTAVEARVKAARRWVLKFQPFFGTLALFAEWRVDESVQTAATDGRTIWISPSYAAGLTASQLAGLLVHELLHCALEHSVRRKFRDPIRWNIAADIVVNGMIAGVRGLELPSGSVRDYDLQGLSVEEVYEQISTGKDRGHELLLVDLVSPPASNVASSQSSWAAARAQAAIIAHRRGVGWGSNGAGVSRELTLLAEPQLPWNALLWQFVVRSQHDYVGFDRRFVGRGLYLEALQPVQLRVEVAIDTSGSVDERQLAAFLAELESLLAIHTDIQGQFYFADAEIYGPFSLTQAALRERPIGGGGTSFEPFFANVGDMHPPPDLCIYFTDGYGTFPTDAPRAPVMWIVPEGGLPAPEFPFGQVARMGAPSGGF